MSYLQTIRQHSPGFRNATGLQIEQFLAQQPDVQRKTGLTNHQHRMNAAKLLFPDRIHLDWYSKKFEAYDRARREGRKEVGFSGGSNSCKTSGLVDMPLTLWWENPQNTTIYIASPYRSATETNIWPRIDEAFNAAKELHPYLPGELLPSASKIRYEDGTGKRAPLSFIQVTTVDDLGKLVGKKSRRMDDGLLIIVIDEAPNLPNRGSEMLSVLVNLKSVKNLVIFYAGNFADPLDFMGKMAEPPGGYEAHRGQEDTMHEYVTKRGGLLYRFDGHQSPNVLAGKDIYDFVTTNEYIAGVAADSGGPNSPDYLRFVRSWPVLDISEYRITNPGKIEAGRAETTAIFNSERLIIVSFCDPGFGGDPCVIQDLRFGVEITDGRPRRVIELDGKPVVVPIDVNKRHPTEKGPDGTYRKVTPEEQIVQFHKEHTARKGIPPENCGFDGSLRAGIVQQYARDWSVKVQAVDPGGTATDRLFNNRSGRKWNEEVANFVSEQWFAVGLCIQSAQLRGLHLSPKAKEQLCARPWAWKGANKKQVQPKTEFKADNAGKSPNEADALCGGLELARQKGFIIESMTPNGGAIAVMSAMRQLQELKGIRNIAAGGMNRDLPPGRLQRTSAETDFRGGLRKF